MSSKIFNTSLEKLKKIANTQAFYLGKKSMVNQETHEMIQDTIEYMWYLDEQRKKAYNQFMQYNFDFMKEKENLEKLKLGSGDSPQQGK